MEKQIIGIREWPIEYGLPEDVCFYRNNELWFSTLSHEKIVFVHSATKNDLDFFKEVGAYYYKYK